MIGALPSIGKCSALDAGTAVPGAIRAAGPGIVLPCYIIMMTCPPMPFSALAHSTKRLRHPHAMIRIGSMFYVGLTYRQALLVAVAGEEMVFAECRFAKRTQLGLWLLCRPRGTIAPSWSKSGLISPIAGQELTFALHAFYQTNPISRLALIRRASRAVMGRAPGAFCTAGYPAIGQPQRSSMPLTSSAGLPRRGVQCSLSHTQARVSPRLLSPVPKGATMTPI